MLILTFSWTACKNDDSETPPGTEEPDERDPRLWPFASTSIWNMPIGSDARYVHAGLEETFRMLPDENYIVMTPDEPPMKVYRSTAGWDRRKSRCVHTGELLFRAPIPHDWIVSPETWDGGTPNAGLAVLLEDGRTVRQSQPFAHCTEGDVATSMTNHTDTDIYGDGIRGAHGGSGLSAIGGALRTHEFTPSSGPIKHALKVDLWGAKNLYYDAETKGYRWPATHADNIAPDPIDGYGRKRITPPVKECRMGALLALPPSTDIAKMGLRTEAARILAQALQDYGAYVVDDSAWDAYSFITEWSPKGRFTDIFKKNWGFSFATDGNDDWGSDLRKIFAQLHVVDNNTTNSVGGGGTPRQPLALPLPEK